MSAEQAEAFAAAVGLTYEAEFVPQSKSRNAGKDPCLNWRVTIKKDGRSLTTDYMQGVAHIPNYEFRFARLVVYDEAVRRACENGKSRLRANQKNGWDACCADRVYASIWDKPIQPPKLIDVLHSLVLDASAIDCASFEEWADEWGLDRDSRKAEQIYRACLDVALQLRQLINLDAAREAFADY